MALKVTSLLPSWYRPVSKIRCVLYCRNGITSSDFNLEAVDTRTGQTVKLAIYCDDVPDVHQCGWGVRH